MKINTVITLGVMSLAISIWFFFNELTYAADNKECLYGTEKCLAEVLAWAGLGQVVMSLAVIIIGTKFKKEKE